MRTRRSTWLGSLALTLALALPGATVGQSDVADADAYQAFVEHTDTAVLKGTKTAESLPADTTLRQYKKWLRRLADWSAKERRWLRKHPAADCFAEQWGYWDDYVRLVSKGSTRALAGIKSASPDRVASASKMIVKASLSFELFQASDSASACEATIPVTETPTSEVREPSPAALADLGSFDDAVRFMESLGLSGERSDSDDGGDGWGGSSLDPFAMATVSGIEGAVDWVSLTTGLGTTSGERVGEFTTWFTGGTELGEWISKNLDTILSESDPVEKTFGEIEAAVSGTRSEEGDGSITVILGLRHEAAEEGDREPSASESPPRSRGGLVITPDPQDG